ncbi:hypothetical protein [Massilia sp. DWR3-1-1]|uniref:hypothetical protein n=1 Tax=Massilia sp. DWR3-1-1 TaxID=2804559 RepID=UPI003CF8C016
MNKAFTPSKLLIGVIAVAAILGGCKKNDVTTAPADTVVTTPSTTTTMPSATPSTTPSTGTTDSTGSSGATGTSAAGTPTMPGVNANPSNEAPKPAVRNNSGETQGTTGSSVPAADGSR